MTKHRFLLELHKKLSLLPPDEVEERVNFYIEMIEDRMEEGMCEEEAVAAIGSVDEIARQITAQLPPHSSENPPAPKEKRAAWKTVLLVLGSPVWASLLLAAAAVIFSLYVTLWSLVGVLWSVFGAFSVCLPCSVFACIGMLMEGEVYGGLALLGAGLILGGLAVFLFYGCKAATTGSVSLTKLSARAIGRLFSRKEEAK